MAEIITRDSEEFKELTGWIKRCGRALENVTARIRPGIADEHYLTGEEVCEKLHVSRRTLQALRDEKAIPYTSITAAGGKLLYPESGLYEVLKKTTRTSGDMPDKQTACILNKKTPWPDSRLKEFLYKLRGLVGQPVCIADLHAQLVRIFPDFRIDQLGINLGGKNGLVSQYLLQGFQRHPL